jgi:hypothetical protein
MKEAKGMNILRKLINEQALTRIIGRIPPADWKHWAKERPS